METRILLLEGPMDVNFFVPILKKLYHFREDRKYEELIPIKSRIKESILSSPIPLFKDDILFVVHHVGGKNNFSKSLRIILKTLHYWENSPPPSIIGIVRDADTNQDVLEWAKSILRDFTLKTYRDLLIVTSNGKKVKVVPFALGNVNLGHPHIKKRPELELVLVRMAEKESTLTKFSHSVEALKEDKGSELTPKDVMHVLAIAKNFGGDSLSGLYRKFIEELISDQRDILVEVLRESGVIEFLGKLTGHDL